MSSSLETDIHQDPERQDENRKPARQHEEEPSPTDHSMWVMLWVYTGSLWLHTGKWNCRCIFPVSTLKAFNQSRLMFLLASNRWVQQSDHSSQTRRGEHRLRQCLFHWRECKKHLDKSGSFHFINAPSIGSFNSAFLPPAVLFLYPPFIHPPFSPSVWSQGYRQKDSYMASQGPLQHTIEDFWRMIWEWRSCSIVMLTELEERGQVCVQMRITYHINNWLK